MNKSFFLIEYNDKEVSGYQTFRDELLSGLKADSSFTIGTITIDADFNSLKVYVDKKYIKVFIPKIVGQYKYERIAAALRLYIPDISTNIFVCNFAPAGELLRSLETFYPLSKRVLVLHDFIAAYYLQGNLNMYHKCICTKNDNIIHPSIGDISTVLIRTLHKEYEKAFKAVHKIVCLCEDTVKFISDEFHIQHKKIILINNGLSDCYQSPTMTDDRKINTFRFIFVGRMTDNKGFCTLLDTVNELVKIPMNCNWEVLCAGPINPLRLKEINNSAASKIRVLGSISRDELYKIYPTVNAALLLSKYEQCSYAGIEFKMFALPVIALSSHGVKNMFNDSNAIVLDAQSESLSKNIAMNMYKLISCDNSILMKYAKKSRDDFVSRYSAKKMAEGYLTLASTLNQ